MQIVDPVELRAKPKPKPRHYEEVEPPLVVQAKPIRPKPLKTSQRIVYSQPRTFWTPEIIEKHSNVPSIFQSFGQRKMSGVDQKNMME